MRANATKCFAVPIVQWTLSWMVCQSVCSFANEDARDHSSIIAITKEKDLQENSIQKLLLQLAHNAGDMSFWRKDVYEGL